MKLSELRPIVKEAHRLGLKKIPGKKRWLYRYTFYETTAHLYITNLELAYSMVSLKARLNMMLNDFWEKYKKHTGFDDEQEHVKELKIYLQEDNK